jgi:glycine cleavage system H protein
VQGEEGVIGVTHYAQQELGDVVYVDAPAVGKTLQAGKAFGTVESVRSVSDLFAPVSGSVTAVNGKLADAPELVNQDPYGDGWMIKVKLSDPKELDGLLDSKAYQALVEAH